MWKREMINLVLPVLMLSLIGCSAVTVPAFLWSSHHLETSKGPKEVVYRTLSIKNLSKSIFEREWSNIICSGNNLQWFTDVVIILIGKELRSSDTYRGTYMDQDLIGLLKNSFHKSNFSIAFPYVSISDMEGTVENSLLADLSEGCSGQNFHVVNFAESCFRQGDDASHGGFPAIHEYTSSILQKSHGQTNLIFYCSSILESSHQPHQKQSEGQVMAELINFVQQAGFSYTALYVSDLSGSPESPDRMQRDLLEVVAKNVSAGLVGCDKICRLKSMLLEGLLVAIVLLLILLSGLCCMMGIDTPARFAALQES